MRVEIKVNGATVSPMKASLRLQSELGQRISTAQFTIVGEEIWSPPSLAIAPISAMGGYTQPLNLDELKIDRGATPFVNCAIVPVNALGGNSTYLDHFFGGYIVSIEKTKIGLNVAGQRVLYRCRAQDYNLLPTKILVTKNYVAQTEAQIIADLFTTYLPEVDSSTYVESSGVVATLDWTRKLLSEAMEELAAIYTKEWYIDYEKYLHYFTPSPAAAPFILSDVPSYSTLLPYNNIQHVEDILGIINKVTVVGDTGIPIVVTRQDNASYAEYGRWFEAKIVDNNIDTVPWANAVGDAVLVESAFAKVDGRLTCYQEGLVKGQKIRIINAFRNIDDYFVIQSLRLSMISRFQEKVSVEYGDYQPRVVDLLLRITKGERKES